MEKLSRIMADIFTSLRHHQRDPSYWSSQYVPMATSAVISSVVTAFLLLSVRTQGPGVDVLPAASLTDQSATVSLHDMMYQNEEIFKNNMLQRNLTRQKIPCDGYENIWFCGNILFKMAYLIPPYSCISELHLAEWGEGGKWLCNVPKAIPREEGIFYSIGSKGKIDYETALYNELGVKSFTFDPTLTPERMETVQSADFINFYEIGLSGSENLEGELNFLNQTFGVSKNAQMLRIDGIMSRLNHSYIDVLKMDCEGCERSVIAHLATITTREKPLFGQGLFEFHKLNDTKPSQLMFDTMESLGYRTFHAEANFYFPDRNWELGFIHESLLKF